MLHSNAVRVKTSVSMISRGYRLKASGTGQIPPLGNPALAPGQVRREDA
jgi:hypothetical protein